jgi:hypothetical protein
VNIEVCIWPAKEGGLFVVRVREIIRDTWTICISCR